MNRTRSILLAITALLVGLIVAGNNGDERLAWLFGVLLMALLPLGLCIAIGSAIFSLFRRSGTKDEQNSSS